ncbi:MAG: apolipoprotein N-acyltransferase [candidate division WOR-3 bacterium]
MPRFIRGLLRLLALLAGLSLLILSGPPFLVFPLGFLALLPLLWVWETSASHGRAFLWAFFSGTIFYLFHLNWIPYMITDVPVPRWLLWLGMSLLVLYEGVWWGMAGVLAKRLKASPAWIGAPGFAACWALLEYIRAHMADFSFPWAPLWAPALADPPLASSAAFWGSFGISFTIALINSLLYRAARARSWKPILWAFGLVVLSHSISLIPNGTRKIGWIRVAIVQPNILLEAWPEVEESYRPLADSLSGKGIQLVILPESAFPGPLRYSGRVQALASLIARSAGAPVVLASWDKEVKRYYNTVFLVSKEGRVLDRYDKVILVPFGEHYPFHEHLPDFITRIDIGVGDYSAGKEVKPIRTDSVLLGPYICYESLFPDVARTQALSGAMLLLNLTNDGWFGTSLGPTEHFHLGRLRAPETGRFILRAGKTGISAIIDDKARIVRRLGLLERGIIVSDVPLVEGKTPYMILGDWPAILSVLILVGALFYTFRKEGER